MVEFRYRSYRFWPIYVLAFMKTFYLSIYGLALPNYLVFDKGINPSLIGIISASYAIAYIFGPIVGERITKRIGARLGIIISSFNSVICLLIQVLFPLPWVLIVFRSLDGFLLGLYWPNLQIEISKWKNKSTAESQDRYFKIYTTSWNSGIIFAYILGFIFVFLYENDFEAIILASALSFIMIPVSFYVEKQESGLNFYNKKGITILSGSLPQEAIVQNPQDIYYLEINSPDEKEDSVINSEKLHFFKYYPIFLCFFIVIEFSFIKGLFNFNIPLIVESFGYASFWVYIINFTQQFAQTYTIRSVGGIKHSKQFILALTSFITLIFIALILYFKANIIILLIFSTINGFLFGVIYSFATQIMWEYETNTGKGTYANIYEVCMGIGFGVAPILGGFIADANLFLNYLFIVFFASIGVICLFSWRLKKPKK